MSYVDIISVLTNINYVLFSAKVNNMYILSPVILMAEL